MSLESLAHAQQGIPSEADWDKLAAMAMGSVNPGRESLLNSLGVSLIGFKHAHRADLHSRAVSDLRDCLRWKVGSSMRRAQLHKIAEAAIQEWVVDMCATCLGSTFVFDSLGVCRPCLTCSGTGKRRYSDAERPGISNRHMDSAHALIAFGVAYAIRQAHARLAP